MKSYSKFDGNTKLSEVLEVLNYEIHGIVGSNKATLYKNEKVMLELATQEQLWHYFLKNYPEKFSGRTKVT